MTTERRRPLSRHESEALLAGRLENHPLHAVLHSAGAPAAEYELAGEQAVVARFRAARAASAITPGSPSMLRSWLARLAAAKILAGAVATTVVCGVALAATTGTLPGPLRPEKRSVTAAGRVTPTAAAPTASRSDAEETGTGDDAGDQRGTGRPTRTGSPTLHSTDEPRTIPAVALRGLCRVWQLAPQAERVRFLGLRPFAALVRTAGGAAKVDPYCLALVGTPPLPPPGRCVRLPHWPLPVGRVTPDHRGGLDEAPGWPTTLPGSWPTNWPSTWPPIVWVPCPVQTGHPTGVPIAPHPGPTRSRPFPTVGPVHSTPPRHG